MKLLSFLLRYSELERLGPIKMHLNNAKTTLKCLRSTKQWFCGGVHSEAVAAELLLQGKIIALPTDTIYGLACLAQNNDSIARLYEIKKRGMHKPLAICLGSIDDIQKWADVEHLPKGLTETLLPGPTTLILKRKSTLNPSLNPEVENVGIRIPQLKFVLSVVRMCNQPIALTSANISNQKSTLHPEEFRDLWPELDGIFYEKMNIRNLKSSQRTGSTIVDLTIEGEFEILREGIGYNATLAILKEFKLIQREATKKNEAKLQQQNEDDIETLYKSEDDTETIKKTENDIETLEKSEVSASN